MGAQRQTTQRYSTTTFIAPNEKGWFTLCGILWGSNVYNDVCAKKSECYIIAESTADFDVTATTGELKAQKEAKEAEEAEAKAAKEAQAKWATGSHRSEGGCCEAKEAAGKGRSRRSGNRSPRSPSEPNGKPSNGPILNPPTIAPLATTKTTVTPTPTHPLVQALTPAQKRAKAVANCKKRYKHNKRKRVKCRTRG